MRNICIKKCRSQERIKQKCQKEQLKKKEINITCENKIQERACSIEKVIK